MSGEPLPNHLCPLCGRPNGCRPAQTGDFATPCWCEKTSFEAQLLARVPADAPRACICAACAAAARAPRSIG